MSYFFLLFCRKMIIVICTILAITIEDLKVHLGILNLLLGKNAIWFEPSVQKGEIGKQTASILYY